MQVIKRDKRIKQYDNSRVVNAIKKAFDDVYKENDNTYIANKIALNVLKVIKNLNIDVINIETIQDIVIEEIKSLDEKVSNAYKKYREDRNESRESLIDKEVESLLCGVDEYWNTENSNKNPVLVTTQRDYLAGIVSKYYARKKLLSKKVKDSHDKGIIHEHDLDYMAQESIHNCDLINLEDMLQNGTVINGKMIEKPHRLITASTIATQIITAVTSSQYGGASITLTHLAPFVRDSYNYHYNRYKKRGFTSDLCERYANEDLEKEIEDAVQTFNYQINSMSTTNGQSPFLSVFMYLSENKEYTKEVAMLSKEFFKQRILGIKNEKRVYVTQEFPKLLYVLEENNIHENSEYWWLTVLGAECSAKRFVPDYISEKKMKEYKEGNCFPCMGCRSFLSPWEDENGNYKFYGRFNQGVCTLNIAYLAYASNGDINKFWELIEEYSEVCHEGLLVKHRKLEGTRSDVAPILWQHGALARLKKGETIDKLLHGGYSSISLGYAGIYEAVKRLIGESHTTKKGKKLAIEILTFLNNKCEKWTKQDNIAYGIYGSPIEMTVKKFTEAIIRDFPEAEEIKKYGYITNSYHVNVRENIDAFTKLSFEGEMQKYSLGGCISYIECNNLTTNIEAVLQVLKYIYNNTVYAEINIKSDYCMECGYDGEIKLDEKLEWYCPNCGNRNHDMMNVSRRTTGYIGSNFWNSSRTAEINDRFVHLGDIEVN